MIGIQDFGVNIVEMMFGFIQGILLQSSGCTKISMKYITQTCQQKILSPEKHLSAC